MARLARLLPRGAADRAWLYLLERQDGVVKVGMTAYPHLRLQNHRTEARKHSTPLVRFHLLCAFPQLHVRAAEIRAVNALARAGQRIERTEEFRGLTFAAALAVVRTAIQEA